MQFFNQSMDLGLCLLNSLKVSGNVSTTCSNINELNFASHVYLCVLNDS
jgi:hypothetical protein